MSSVYIVSLSFSIFTVHTHSSTLSLYLAAKGGCIESEKSKAVGIFFSPLIKRRRNRP